MGVIISDKLNYNAFTAVLDFTNSEVVNTFVFNNQIGVTSISTTAIAGQFKVNLDTAWIDQRTFIQNIVVPNGSDPIIDVYFICWDRNFSGINDLLFGIIDKNGNYANNLNVNGIAFEIRIYDNQTTL